MIKNYFSVVLRNIRQSPLYAFINVFSLAIGLACCIVIYLFINDERSFDDFHSKKENIYRLNQVQNFSGGDIHKVPLSNPGMGPAMLNEFPEVVAYTRIQDGKKVLVVRDEKQFVLPHLAFVDSTFLEIFDFELLYGDRSNALDAPYTMVVTKATALKFFKSTEEAMGSTLTYCGYSQKMGTCSMPDEYKITGILENFPENSHLQFDALTSLTSRGKDWGSNVEEYSFITYLLLQPNAMRRGC